MPPPRPLTLLLGCVALLLSAATVRADFPEEAVKQVRQAHQLIEQGDSSRAIAQLRTLTEEHPTFAEAHRMLGHALLQTDQLEAARAAMLDALRHGRLTADVLGTLIRIDQRRGDRVAMLGALPLMTVLQNEQRVWPHLWADTLQRLGRTEAATALFEVLHREAPANPRLLLSLANARLAAGEHATAVRHFATAYHLDAGNADRAELARTVASLHRRLEHPRAAMVWYSRAIDHASAIQRAALQLERAGTRLALDLPLDRARKIERIAKSDSKDVATRAADLLGRAAAMRSDTRQAVQWWTRAAEHGLDRPAVFRFLAGHHFNAERYKQAARWFGKLFEQSSRDETARQSYVRPLLALDRPSAARNQLRILLAHHGMTERAAQLIAMLPRPARD